VNSGALARQLDLREIWRLVQKDVETEYLDNQVKGQFCCLHYFVSVVLRLCFTLKEGTSRLSTLLLSFCVIN
jgi:hypothetical protein